MAKYSRTVSKAPAPVAKFFIGRIFPLPFILAGGAVLAFGLRNVNRANSSTHWPTAEAVIRESRVASHSGNKGGTTYSAEVRYEFTVAGVVHSGDSVGFGDFGSSDSDKYRRIVNRYPVGSKTKVSYMPEDPSVVVLEPGVKGQTWFLPGAGAVFFLAGCAMAVFLPRTLRKQTAAAEISEKNPGDSPTPIPSGAALQGDHPKVVRRAGIAGTEFETAAGNLFGTILIAIAAAQIVFLLTVFRDSLHGFMIIPFVLADTVMLTLGTFILLSRYVVSVEPDRVKLFIGKGALGIRREIRRTPPMSVKLEYRNASKNGRQLDAIVIANNAGEEFHFGSFLDDSRKNFLAGHLAKLLAPKSETRANPFA